MAPAVRTPEAEPVAAQTKPTPPPRATPARGPETPRPATPPPKLPAILFEGDAPPPPPALGPGEQVALAPTRAAALMVAESARGHPTETAPARELELLAENAPERRSPTLVPEAPREPSSGVSEVVAELPRSYGTGRLFATARDPRWLHVHWDFSDEQLELYRSFAADQRLTLKVHLQQVSSEPFAVIGLPPGVRSWFVHVGRGDADYLAELGYQDNAGVWQTLAMAPPVRTPSETVSVDATVEVATVPIDVPFEELLEQVQAAAAEGAPLVRVLDELRAAGQLTVSWTEPAPVPAWKAGQEQALAEVVAVEVARRGWVNSVELVELARHGLRPEAGSGAAPMFSVPGEVLPPPGALGGVSSVSVVERPVPPGGGPRAFWFNLNAELIIYGATEPDARVTLGRRVIKLRPDGTFTLRFALPDGCYELPVVATSAANDDGRSAVLHFGRQTDYWGALPAPAQDPGLEPPHSG